MRNCFAAVFKGRFARPLPERSHEAFFVVKADIASDLLNGAGSPHQTLGRQVPSNFILHLLEGRPLVQQPTVQGAE
jgi:hypothetical protein